jgi:hypothetical protein
MVGQPVWLEAADSSFVEDCSIIADLNRLRAFDGCNSARHLATADKQPDSILRADGMPCSAREAQFIDPASGRLISPASHAHQMSGYLSRGRGRAGLVVAAAFVGGQVLAEDVNQSREFALEGLEGCTVWHERRLPHSDG